MAKEYRNYRNMKSIKGIMKNKSDKMNQGIDLLKQKMDKLMEHVQKQNK